MNESGRNVLYTVLYTPWMRWRYIVCWFLLSTVNNMNEAGEKVQEKEEEEEDEEEEVEVEVEPECAIAHESRPPRTKLTDIARFWINSLRAAIYAAGDAGAGVVKVVGTAATPEMGNLQSDGKRKNKKNKSIDSQIDEQQKSKENTSKLSKSLDRLDQQQPLTNVAFQKVQTPARRSNAPKASSEKPEFRDGCNADEEEKKSVNSLHPEDVQAQTISDPGSPPLSYESSIPPDPWDSTVLGVPTSSASPPTSLPVRTEGPPLLVTDSWHRANKSLVTPDVPTPPSQESSSDSVFTVPGGMVADSGSLPANIRETQPVSPPVPEDREDRRTHFTVTRHKKIELVPASSRIGGAVHQDVAITSEKTPRRHSANETQTTESNVLRRVASLTLDRATLEGRANNKPKFVPEKLDFRLYEKFEGQHLMNWLVSGLPDHLRRQLTEGDQKRLGSTVCAHLVAAGVLKPLSDKAQSKDVYFTPDLMYEWSHQEAPIPVITSPGKLRRESWSPENIRRLEEELYALRCEVSRLRALINVDEKEARGQSTQTSPDGLSSSKFFVESGRFTASPTEVTLSPSENSCSLRFEESLRNDAVIPSMTLSPISEVETSVDQWAVENVKPQSSSSPKDDRNTSHRVNRSLENGKHIGDISLLAFNLNALKIEDECPHEEPTTDSAMTKIDNEIQDLSRLTEKIQNLEFRDKSLSNGESVVDLNEEDGTIKQPTIVETVNDMVTGPPMSQDHKVQDSVSEITSESISSSVKEETKNVSISQDGGSCLPPPPPPPPMPDLLETLPQEHSALSKITPCQTPPPPPHPLPIFDGEFSSTSQNLTADISLPPPPPPPPMPGIIVPPPPPPPPPMPGMGGPPPPPPPPMPGMGGPPPPPMPGMGPPPPPMPGMGGPPPPPMPGMMGMPPPPPPPPGFGGPPPPPPPGGLIPPPPPPGGNSPKPFPTPPAGGWNPPGRATLRKEPLNPVVPMKPLYWTRILVPSTVTPIPANSPDSPPQIPLWAEIEEEKSIDITEFANLFSRQVIERKPTKKKDETDKPSKIQPAKILDSKRSKMVGILEKSLHVDFSEVENAVYTLDTSVVNLEALKQIYEVRPSAKELEEIAAHEEAHPEIPLDRPEKFLKQLSSIPHFAQRIACLMFQSEFQDAISSVSTKLTNLRSICEYLRNSNSLKKVMALILTLGNYMNGGNRMRGQADGFGLEILGKLKDVKSKVPGVTLLHYVARARLAQEEPQNLDEPLPLPIPEPADVEAAASINFEDLTKELDRLGRELDACNKKYKMVAESNPENAGPFKEKMETFLSKAVIDLANEKESLQEARAKFKIVMQFYQYVPKGATLDTADPHDFFILWQSFCKDFKDIWKKEQQRLAKERRQEARKKFEEKRRVEKVKKDDTGLTARLRKLAGRK